MATAGLAGLLAAGTSVPASAGAEPGFITDEHGRALILHGLNTAGSAKGASGLPAIDEDDVVQERRKLGSNVVRYLVQWKNVEPEPGVYDEAYLDAVAERVRWYGSQGVHVVLDMHQDIYGPAACQGAGNGAPAWATFTDGLPCKPQSPWVLTYLQPAVLRAYDNFWNNTGKHPELAAHYAAMWRHVAARFKDDPAVLGYDLMNEPFGGTRQFGFFEEHVLTPFYQRIIDAVRGVDGQNWIFVEPQSLGVNQGTPSSLGELDGERIALAPHFYPAAIDLGGTSYSGAAKALVKAEFAAWRLSMTGLSRRLGRPLWIGEIGSVPLSIEGAADFTRDWLDFADGLRLGWAYWSNDPGVAPLRDGELNDLGRLMARPYPRAVAGVPTAIKATETTLTVSWRTAPATAPTEIWLPATFGDAPAVTTTAPHTWDAATRTLLVHNGDAATVTVKVG